MERGRVVAVEAAGRRVSGYVVAARLVLTCAHDVPEPGGTVLVFGLAETVRCAGRVVWRGTPGGEDDVALVEVVDSRWRPRSGRPVRWGRLVTDRVDTRCQTWGFPALMARGGVGADTAQLSGKINIGNSYAANRYVMDIHQVPPDGAWSGMSGAAVFCKGLLAGVVFQEPAHARHGQLRAVPTAVPLQDTEFRAVVGAHGVETATRSVELQALAEPDEPGMRSPAALLRAHREVVAFRGRVELLDELAAWCESGWAFDTRLVHGSGGQGKTRLARELANRLRERRWEALWLHKSAVQADLSVLAEVAVPLLVIADYAETRLDLVARVIEVCERAGGEHPVRLLLLARSAGDWRSQLAARSPAAAEHATTMESVALPPLEPEPGDRDAAYRAARTALAAHLPAVPTRRGHTAPDWEQLDASVPVPRLGASGFGGALTLHTTALADLLDAAYPGAIPEDTAYAGPVEDRLLIHERAYWTDAATAAGLTPLLGEPALEDALVAAFLTGADTRDEADTLLARVPRLADETPERRGRVRAWIASVYPPPEPERPWDTMQPDRLAERLVGTRLHDDPTLADHLVTAATTGQLHRTLTVYARAAAQPAFAGALDQPLAILVVTHHDTLAVPAVDIATRVERPAPLAFALTRITQDPDISLDYLRNLSDYAPKISHALADWTALLETRRVDLERHATPDANQPSPALASSLNNQAIQLGELGRHEEALAAIKESVGVYRRLADARPHTHLPALAASLNNQAVRLRELGRHEEALAAIEESVAIRHRLADARPTPTCPPSPCR